MTKLSIHPKNMLLCPAWAPPDPRGTFIALALAGEAGELANLFKKEWRDGVDAARRAKMIDELGDVMVYVRALGQHLGVDVLKESDKKLKAFRKRPEFPRILEEAKRRYNEEMNDRHRSPADQSVSALSIRTGRVRRSGRARRIPGA